MESNEKIFRRFGQQCFRAGERRSQWHADAPVRRPSEELRKSQVISELLPLEDFIQVDDFEVIAEEVIDSGSGYNLYFFSQSKGYLTSFPWGDNIHRQLAQSELKIPLGTAKEPFTKSEPACDITVFQHKNFAYVLEGSGAGSENYHTWFKVPIKEYRSAWNSLVKSCKTMRKVGDVVFGYLIEEICQDVGRGWIYKASATCEVSMREMKNSPMPMAIKMVDAVLQEDHNKAYDRWGLYAKNFFCHPGRSPAAHRNVCVFYAFARDEGRTMHAREYYDGPSLKQLVEKQGPLDWNTTVGLVKQVLDGLKYVETDLHTRYFDLKPGTIILTAERNGYCVHLTDMGLTDAYIPLPGAPGPQSTADERACDLLKLICYCLSGKFAINVELDKSGLPSAFSSLLRKANNKTVTLPEIAAALDGGKTATFFKGLFK